MFDVSDRHQFHFGSVQMPLNVIDAHFDSFEQGVLPVAVARGTGILGMRAPDDNFILESNVMTPTETLQYAMGLPISVQVTGIDSMPILRQALDAVKTFQPPTPGQRAAILLRSVLVAGAGAAERYKISNMLDGIVRNPHWLD